MVRCTFLHAGSDKANPQQKHDDGEDVGLKHCATFDCDHCHFSCSSNDSSLTSVPSHGANFQLTWLSQSFINAGP
jgi:hypothetical protein